MGSQSNTKTKKMQFAIASVVPAMVLAGKSEILSQLENLNKQDRAFLGMVATHFDTIDGYGCWCNFGANYTKGHGKPQDLIDEQLGRFVKSPCSKIRIIGRENKTWLQIRL